MTEPHTTPPRAVAHGAVTEARRVVAAVCADLRGGELLDPSFERHASGLDMRDRRWSQELVYGMLRRRAVLDALLDDRVRGGLARLDADVIDLLRIGAYQLMHMGSVPAYAAIAQTVELAKIRHGLGASKLVNAVLRRLDREQEQLSMPLPDDPIDALALNYSHPRWLVARWVARWQLGETERLLKVNNTEAPLVIRPYRIGRPELEEMLAASGSRLTDVPLVPDSMRIVSPVSLADLPAFREGLFFVQDPAATLVAHYAAVPENALVADLCSAPGGKTLELSRTAQLVIAADRSLGRVERVRTSALRLDARNVRPLVADAREPAIQPVDAVILDAPCSGTGTFRRHPDARWRLRISDLSVLALLQTSLLRAAAMVVRPGGLLIYSTCSLELEENEAQVERFLAEHKGWQLEPPPEGTVPAETLDRGALRLLPHKHGTDGAFAARLRRDGG